MQSDSIVRSSVRSRRNRGNTFIEAVLVLFLLLFVMIAIIDVGTVLLTYQGILQRAHAGARYAVVTALDPAEVTNVVVYGNAAGAGSPILGLDTEMVSVTDAPMDNQLTRVSVVIANYPIRFFTPLLVGSSFLPRVEVVLTRESGGAAG